MKTNQNLLESFVHYLSIERRYSEETVKAYLQDLKKFELFLKESGTASFVEVRLFDVRTFLSFLDEEELSRNTISRILSSLRGFYGYLLREKMITENPVSSITFKNRSLRLPKYLYDEELEKIFEAAKGIEPLDYRNIAILELLYATGIRVSECRNITLEDIDFTLGVILIIGKGNKERYVPFGHFALEAMEQYLQKGREPIMMKYHKTHSTLFVNRLGDPLTTSGMEHILNTIMKKTGMTGNLHPHMMRHTFATDMLNGGADMRTVQELLGHSSLSSTQIYTHVTKDVLQKNYRAYHPRAKRKK
ncbi:tyrosine recombinase XerC [Jeotgalibaca ciconiae]|uniref:Tyrosine recombinase XerC n=1 Tax=Jeotgalibaca ciconiae TaxID=2496265 RepID=A0A3Q9BMG7_9LACT|nr:tyrosine recombinase XerC [Jeotgalibaca ciconiae]AZP05372.1 tyrosine recombinase XerC [Jeotgalibaca ciconiae]HJB22753.1 tyrosine recombinase XerC [Candidatus Jeotgalibaca pullicola]